MRLVALSDLTQFAAVNITSDPGRLPGPKVIPNCALFRLNWTLGDGKTAHNICYGAYTGSPALSVTQANSGMSFLTSGGVWTALAAFIHPTCLLASVTLLDVRSNTGTEITSTLPAVPGTSTGTALPDEVAANITLRTANRGPSGRGRVYIPGWATNALGAGNVIAAGAVTALNNWASSILPGAIATAVGPMQLGLPARQAYTSPITGRNFPARAATTVPITSLVVRDNHWDSQRRRGLR